MIEFYSVRGGAPEGYQIESGEEGYRWVYWDQFVVGTVGEWWDRKSDALYDAAKDYTINGPINEEYDPFIDRLQNIATHYYWQEDN